jgi:hypothetical protein
MSKAQTIAKVNLGEGFGKSTLLNTTNVFIPMPRGAKEPAATTNDSKATVQKPSEGKR